MVRRKKTKKTPPERRTHLRNPIEVSKALGRAEGNLTRAVSKLGEAEAVGRGVKPARRDALHRAFENVMARHRLSRLAIMDSKFRIFNDRAFNEKFFRFLKSSVSRRQRFCFAIADFDNLKHLNATRGYAVADHGLKIFTEGLAKIARKFGGVAGRFGGDEVKLFARCSPSQLKTEMNRLISEMRSHGFSFSVGIGSSHFFVAGEPDPSGKMRRNFIDGISETALEQAKKKKAKGTVVVYKPAKK